MADDALVDHLSSMFPDIERETLEIVLASVNNEVSAAAETLLSMNDPQPPPPPSTVAHGRDDGFREETDASQLARDEELARQLQQQLNVVEQTDEDLARQLARAHPPSRHP